MLPNSSPALGANSACLGAWNIYIFDPHGLRWKSIGTMADRATAEYQIAAIRRFLPGRQFCLAWNAGRES
jgi:hypothetical protein